MDIKDMMRHAKSVQQKMEELTKEAPNIEAEGISGGDQLTVKAVVNGMHAAKKVEISEELIKSGDKEMLEDLVIAALNNARDNADKKVREMRDKELKALGLPAEMLKNMGV